MTGLVSATLLVLSLATTALPPPSPTDSAGSADAVWPLAPRPAVVAGFDPPEHPWEAGHRGVDLAGTVGQSVRAGAAGTVTFAGMLAGRGVVVVDHGDRRTTYEPVAATVRRGDDVRTGALLGTLDRGPGHCFPQTCLHWGLIAGTDYQDPLDLLHLGPVRLLPLLDLLDLLEPGR